MRAYLPAYDLRQPASLEEALRLLSEAPGAWRPFAGGTDLMVVLESGRLPRQGYVSLWGLPGLRGVDASDEAVTIGAVTTYSDVMRDPVLGAEYPLLAEAARETGGVATQNRGTIGGNIANASPAADTPPALLVYDAELELASVRGTRRVPYDTFHTGYKRMDLAPDEIITAIRLPRRRRRWLERYRKVGTRRAQAISKVCFAGALQIEDGLIRDVRLAFGSVAPTVVRCRHTESLLRGTPLAAAAEALTGLDRDIAPIDDVRSTAWYRRRVAANLLGEFLRTAGTAG
jgi:CO/xanthine dehydrogenase FAD-binding subunit